MKRFLDGLSVLQRRLFWFLAFVFIFIIVARLIAHMEWLSISIALTFFGIKELFEYSRLRNNSKAKWQ
jgi:hypothetical protein